MTLHRSTEEDEHDYCTGIPVRMPLVDANPLQAEVDRLRGKMRVARLRLKREGEVLHSYCGHDGDWWDCKSMACAATLELYRVLEAE